MRRRDKLLLSLAIVLAVLVAARVALPYVVKDQVNERLAAMPNYDGYVADVDIALWRGAYRLVGLRIEKTGIEQATPFFSSDVIDLSVEWRSLLRGSVVATAALFRPYVNLVQAANERESQLGVGVNWHEQLQRLFPFRFNTIVVRDGTVTFRAPAISTKDALNARRVNGEITNMTNVAGSDEETFAGFRVTGLVLESGVAVIGGRANPLADTPTFDVNLTVKNVELPQVNPWLREYIKADAEAGSFELYTELAAADGKFRGYAKPIMRDVDIYRSGEPEKNPFKRLWEGLVDFAAEVLEDEDTDQVAARVPLRGTIENPDASIMETVVSVPRNAFVAAFARSLEDSVSLRDVKKGLEKIGDEAKPREKQDE